MSADEVRAMPAGMKPCPSCNGMGEVWVMQANPSCSEERYDCTDCVQGLVPIVTSRFVTVTLPDRPGDPSPYSGLAQIAVVDLVGTAGFLANQGRGVIWCVSDSVPSADRIASALSACEPADGGKPDPNDEPF